MSFEDLTFLNCIKIVQIYLAENIHKDVIVCFDCVLLQGYNITLTIILNLIIGFSNNNL